MTDRAALAAHLRYYADLGVTGLSRDAAWRDRLTPDVDGGEPIPDRPGADADVVPHVAHAVTGGAAAIPTGAQAVSEGDTDPATRLALLHGFIGPCTRCKLHAMGRTQVVFGVGNPQARLMFVGEAPGADEDAQGEPFVGRAGQLLTRIIEGGLEMPRSEVYIANVIKCRPPGNRNPEPDEVATCEPFLFEQIDTIRPKVIVALGKFAAQALLKTDAPISRIRGKVHDFRNGAKLIPTFHPAFLLRSPEHKREVWEDMKTVRALLAEDA
jgi:uracil-DNA glycosylase family 4